MNKLRLAVVGAGHLGKFHAKLLSSMEGVELVAVADPVTAAREQVAADCRTRPVADFRELFGQVDGVVIATPTRLHHAVALEFLTAGTHVLVEKPITVTLEEADELIAAARRSQVVLQVGHIERFNPAFVQSLPYVQSPKYIEAARYSGYTFRSTDIGVVLDLMIHDIDATMALAGSEVERVEALGVAVLGQHEDIAQTRLTFANGCVANLSASRVSFQPMRQMQVWSQSGFAKIDFSNRTSTIVAPSATVAMRQFDQHQLSAEQKTHHKDHLFEELLPLKKLEAEPANAMLDELKDFAESIRARRAPQVTGQHGRDALAVAYRILDSIAAHQWEGAATGPVGPQAAPMPSVLRGPHWGRVDAPVRKQAG